MYFQNISRNIKKQKKKVQKRTGRTRKYCSFCLNLQLNLSKDLGFQGASCPSSISIVKFFFVYIVKQKTSRILLKSNFLNFDYLQTGPDRFSRLDYYWTQTNIHSLWIDVSSIARYKILSDKKGIIKNDDIQSRFPGAGSNLNLFKT